MSNFILGTAPAAAGLTPLVTRTRAHNIKLWYLFCLQLRLILSFFVHIRCDKVVSLVPHWPLVQSLYGITEVNTPPNDSWVTQNQERGENKCSEICVAGYLILGICIQTSQEDIRDHQCMPCMNMFIVLTGQTYRNQYSSCGQQSRTHT